MGRIVGRKSTSKNTVITFGKKNWILDKLRFSKPLYTFSIFVIVFYYLYVIVFMCCMCAICRHIFMVVELQTNKHKFCFEKMVTIDKVRQEVYNNQ